MLSTVISCQTKWQSTYKKCTPLQQQQLQQQGNKAEDWNAIYVVSSEQSVDNIESCQFYGRNVIGMYDQQIMMGGQKVSTGLYQSTFCNCVMEDNVLVQGTPWIESTFIGRNSIVWYCGNISRKGNETSFGNGLSIPVGIEIGGRNLECYAELSFDTAVQVGKERKNTKFQEIHHAQVATYAKQVRCTFNIIERDAQLLHCMHLQNVFVGEQAILRTSEVVESTILSSKETPTRIENNASIQNSIIQMGCVISTMSIVQNSFMCESSTVTLHGKLLQSYLGPNSGISEGECTSSFVGPFVGFHHQALLIAAFWPEGKGNIGYGANVGSNHTLKAPDQELWPGEGLFFGLGTNIKFPSNFQKAPYSVIATAVNTLPQRLEMPFSLINSPSFSSEAVSPAFNEIMPGWVLSSCMFTVLRNEHKYRTRNKAVNISIEFKIFRPDIIEMMQVARKRLQEAKPSPVTIKKTPLYFEKQVPGIGKNYLTESSRNKAIETYSFFIRHYIYQELWEQRDQNPHFQLDQYPEFLQHLIQQECYKIPTREQWLQQILQSYAHIAKSAEEGKHRDDVRGMKIIPDYTTTHRQAKEEPIVQQAQEQVNQIQQYIQRVLHANL